MMVGLIAGSFLVPVWAQVVIAMASVVVAVGVIWGKLLRPGVRVVSQAEKILPVVTALTDQFANTAPASFKVLSEIAEQFQTDHGTSLRDVINRLEQTALETAAVVKRLDTTANENQAAARVLQANFDVYRRMAEQDRTQLAEAVTIIRKVRAGVDDAATELEASQRRADEVDTGDESTGSGAAADAASRPPPEKRKQ